MEFRPILALFFLLASQPGLGYVQDQGTDANRRPIPKETKVMQAVDYPKILRESNNPDELEKTAKALVKSSDESELTLVGNELKSEAFLRRLDKPHGAGIEVDRFRRVLLDLGENPSPYSSAVLSSIGMAPAIRSQVDRVDVFLEAAAALKPLPAERAALFGSFGPNYFLLNFHLLVANGSPIAIQELEREIAHRPPEIEPQSVVSAMHRWLLPHRTEEPVIQMAWDLAHSQEPQEIKIGLFESFFDNQSRQWFGPIRSPPEPANLHEASTTALLALRRLAVAAGNMQIPAELADKVSRTAKSIDEILEQRGNRK
jgi:hypothetical protein